MNEQLRRIVISGVLRDDTAALFLEQITALECVDMSKAISVYVDTYGGSLDAALCMYDAMKACCCPIVTIGIGKVMSAGVLLLSAGDKGSRFITQNTRVMIHEVSSGTEGAINEMSAAIAEMKNRQEAYIDLLSNDSGVSKAKLRADMAATTYMSAEEAVKYGFVDEMVPTRRTTRKVTVKKKKATKKTTKK